MIFEREAGFRVPEEWLKYGATGGRPIVESPPRAQGWASHNLTDDGRTKKKWWFNIPDDVYWRSMQPTFNEWGEVAP